MRNLKLTVRLKKIRDLYSGINVSKKSYQPGTNAVKDEKSELVADSYSILATWRNYFSQVWNVHGVNDVRHTEIHTAEPQVPEQSAFEMEMVTETLKSHKSPGSDQIPAELIKAGDRTIGYKTHKLTIFTWNKKEMPEEWREAIIVHIYNNKTNCSNYKGTSLLPTTYKILSNILLSRLTPYTEEIIGDHQGGKKWEYNEAMHQLFIDFQDSLEFS